MSNSRVIALTQDLIRRKSVTPADAGCQEMMAGILKPCGFNIETMVFEDTTNMWARKGSNGPVLVLAGHTDVVPTGPEEQWHIPPFDAELRDGYIHGRGAADMKGSLGAMLVATERFVAKHPDHKGSIAYLITSDEEGPFINGTTRVIDTLEARNEKFEWCIVGEPSSTHKTGDVIKNGRRGSLTGELKVKGIQGHVAYPHLVDNPIHKGSAALAELAQTHWDDGNEFFPPTSFQISNIHSGTGATNVVPGEMDVIFNFRYSTEVTYDELQQRVTSLLDAHALDYELSWIVNGLPFITESGDLIDATVKAVEKHAKITPELLTSGGTSDGRFIAQTGAQVIELGPCNATIHKLNECVKASDLEVLADMYEEIMVQLLT